MTETKCAKISSCEHTIQQCNNLAMKNTFYIKTFGCQQNEADSERIKAALEGRGMKPATSYKDAQYVVINTCMIREMAENRVYGTVNNLVKNKLKEGKPEKIVFYQIPFQYY